MKTAPQCGAVFHFSGVFLHKFLCSFNSLFGAGGCLLCNGSSDTLHALSD
jgi:hypothetical protein